MFGSRHPRRPLVALILAVGVLAVGGGLLLLGSGTTTTTGTPATSRLGHGSEPVPPGSGLDSQLSQALAGAGPSTTAGSTFSPSMAGQGMASTSGTPPTAAPNSASLLGAPPVPAGPQIVRTATIDLGLKGQSLNQALASITALATTDGGYVDNDSTAGGSAQSAPQTGTIVIRVANADLSDALARLAGMGNIVSQAVKEQDVTGQVADAAAQIQALQAEVNLLQSKLNEAGDIGSFLQIEGQLSPVAQQLQQLETQQAILQNFVTLATVTVDLTAPGVVAAAPPVVHPPNALDRAWRFAGHNSLVVLDALAVSVGYALPALILGGLLLLVRALILRRRRQLPAGT